METPRQPWVLDAGRGGRGTTASGQIEDGRGVLNVGPRPSTPVGPRGSPALTYAPTGLAGLRSNLDLLAPRPVAHGLDRAVRAADDPPMRREDTDRLRLVWEANGRGDLGALSEALDPEVRWYGADDPSASCQSREAVLQLIRQACADGVTVELLDLRTMGGKVLAVMQRHHPLGWGQPPEPHGEVITLRGGKVSEMVFCPTVKDALDALSPR